MLPARACAHLRHRHAYNKALLTTTQSLKWRISPQVGALVGAGAPSRSASLGASDSLSLPVRALHAADSARLRGIAPPHMIMAPPGASDMDLALDILRDAFNEHMPTIPVRHRSLRVFCGSFLRHCAGRCCSCGLQPRSFALVFAAADAGMCCPAEHSPVAPCIPRRRLRLRGAPMHARCKSCSCTTARAALSRRGEPRAACFTPAPQMNEQRK
jgi:hypothetical protein